MKYMPGLLLYTHNFADVVYDVVSKIMLAKIGWF